MADTQSISHNVIDALRNGTHAFDPRSPGLFVEVTAAGRRVWKYRRRIAGSGDRVKATLGGYPAFTIADARKWAAKLNETVERGVDPREAERAAKAAEITVAEAHALYIDYVRAGARRAIKASTIAGKMEHWNLNIRDQIGSRVLSSITADELWTLVLKKGETAPIQANRLAGELKFFLKWCAGRGGRQAGIILAVNPGADLDAYYFQQTPRKRFLSHEELEWFLRAVALEDRIYQRALLLLLLTGCRRNEVLCAPMAEFSEDMWTVDASRTKNSEVHRIPLTQWMRALSKTNSAWLIPSSRKDAPRADGWCKILMRVEKRMSEFAGTAIEHFVLHDLRRTFRSNTKRLKIDFDTAEAMLNHKKTGLEEIYDGYDLLDEKREGYAKWEAFLIGLAVKAGVAEALDCPVTKPRSCHETFELPLI